MGSRTRRACAAAVRHAISQAVIESLESRRLLAATVGPDNFGYTATSQTYAPVTLSSDSVRLFEGVDDDAASIDLGENTFNFYGSTYSGPSSLYVSSNGLITFGQGNSYYSNDDLTSLYTPTIAVLWRDWIGAGASERQVAFKFQDDQLVIQWNTFVYGEIAPSDVTFQAVLQLNTSGKPGDITLSYIDLDTDFDPTDNGADSTVGTRGSSFEEDKLLISGPSTVNADLVGHHKSILIHSDTTGFPSADAGDDQSPPEGTTSVTLDGSGSSDAEQSAASLHYDWDFDGDRIFGETGDEATGGDETGIHPTYNVGPSGLYMLALRVTDSDGHRAFDTVNIEIINTPPTAHLTAPSTATAYIPTTVTVSGEDTTSEFLTYSIDWGDGYADYPSDENGSNTTASHAYLTEGTYTIYVTASDSEGFSSEAVTREITVGPRPDVLLTETGLLVVTGTSGDDTITFGETNTGEQVRLSRNGVVTTYTAGEVLSLDIDSGGGDDEIFNSLGTLCTINSGDGNDTITTRGSGDTVNAGEGNNTVTVDFGGNANITTGSGDDHITVDGSASIYAADGDNFIEIEQGDVTTGGGNDTIQGGDGGVNVSSGDGDDSIVTGDGSDSISCYSGATTIKSNGGADWISTGGIADSGNDPATGATIDSGEDTDNIQVWGYAKEIISGDGDDFVTAYFAGSIDGGAGDDLIRCGSDVNNPAAITGGDGADRIYTGDGFDSIYGGAGKDTIHSGNGGDLISGGGGNDLIFAQGGHDRLYGGAGTDRLFGQGGDDRILGASGSDTIDGGDGDNAAEQDDPLDELTNIQSALA